MSVTAELNLQCVDVLEIPNLYGVKNGRKRRCEQFLSLAIVSPQKISTTLFRDERPTANATSALNSFLDRFVDRPSGRFELDHRPIRTFTYCLEIVSELQVTNVAVCLGVDPHPTARSGM